MKNKLILLAVILLPPACIVADHAGSWWRHNEHHVDIRVGGVRAHFQKMVP